MASECSLSLMVAGEPNSERRWMGVLRRRRECMRGQGRGGGPRQNIIGGGAGGPRRMIALGEQ